MFLWRYSVLRIMTLCWSVRISLAFCLWANVSLFVLRVFSNFYCFWKCIVQCFQATSNSSQEWNQSRLAENRLMLVVKWTFDELYFLSSSLFFLLLLSIVISYVSFMAVIWWIKVYISLLSQDQGQDFSLRL